MPISIDLIPAFTDNYIYLITDDATGESACVDPAQAQPLIEAASEAGKEVSHILLTHPHFDHAEGMMGVKQHFDARTYLAWQDGPILRGITDKIGEGDEIRIGESTCEVWCLPGHTSHHLGFWFKADKAFFCGDTLFSLGCGRVFSGTAMALFYALERLKSLPLDTVLYPTHEYTSANADFALTIEPDNADLQARAKQVQTLREKGLPTVPVTLADELKANPFLRCDKPAVQAALGMSGAEPVDVFVELRKRKDHF